jgi:unsaturated rhamnogalacturonyl hydrolase
MQANELRDTIDRVIKFTMTRQVERTTWEKASAMSGMLAWQNDNAHAVTKRWLERAIATQTSEGNLNYSDREEYPHGHSKVLTPTASLSSSLGYPLLLQYERSKDKALLEGAKRQADALMKAPRTKDGGVWGRQEGPELWIDYIYMICPFLAKYGLVTGDKKYIDEAYTQFTVHAKHCVDALTGLGRHCWCEKPNHYPQSMLWARGNGWLVAGGVDLLALAPDHPSAKATKETTARALGAMRDLQDHSGYMRHILDDPQAKLEASSTLMFAYAAARAVDLGIVGKEFDEAAKRAFLGVAGVVGEDGAVTGVAVPPGGPGVQFGWTMFGQGFFLLAANALKGRLGM